MVGGKEEKPLEVNGGMESFYFTFGIGHKHNGFYRIIVAPDEITAQKRMFELHGKEWALPYTEEEWDEACYRGSTRNLKQLHAAEVVG